LVGTWAKRSARAAADGVILKALQNDPALLLMMEYKRAIGEGGCDALVQASHSAWKYWRHERVSAVDFSRCDFEVLTYRQMKGIRDKCCCPSFIIGAGGPYLAILGAILTDKYVVQRLTSLEWLGVGQVFEDKHLYRIAQVFESLRGALQKLDEFYDEVDEQTLKLVEGHSHPRFLPPLHQIL
jgi:hypothetical protein